MDFILLQWQYLYLFYRSQKIRWSFALVCATEFILCGATIAAVIDLYVIRPFEDFETKSHSSSYIILSILRCNLSGVFLMMCVFYMTLHAFQNIFAELTRFADRQFYQVLKNRLLHHLKYSTYLLH